jgi:YggT family protein
MAQLMGFLSSLVSIYMMIVFFRIILTWFSWIGRGSLQNILATITDPYLNWFRRFPILRVGFLDLSPIAALAVLSLLNRIFSTLALHGTISIGIVLSMILQMLWGAVSFLIGFLIIVFILRLIAHLTRVNTYSQFWRIVDAIFQPVSYRINRILFKDRIVNFISSVIISVVGLVGIYLVLRVFVIFVSGVLARLPI